MSSYPCTQAPLPKEEVFPQLLAIGLGYWIYVGIS